MTDFQKVVWTVLFSAIYMVAAGVKLMQWLATVIYITPSRSIIYNPFHGDSAANQCVGCVSPWWVPDLQNLEGRLTYLLFFREVVMGDSPESKI